ncbi:hypothetical protein [Spongiactinospora sp. 9N601]|uniref:hypothetical protein n=1 Tax=Spongiactinospora sp. 9N601 TaxID=3375149 RepID=UPI0037C5DC2F
MTRSWNPNDFPPSTDEQVQAAREAVARVRAAIAIVVTRSFGDQALDVVHTWELSRKAMDDAAERYQMPPISDEEWEIVTDRRGGRVDGPSS